MIGCVIVSFFIIFDYNYCQTVECKNSQEICVIHCNATNICRNYEIVGNNATVMTVSCNADNGCQGSRIYCPRSQGSQCNIICTGPSSCCGVSVTGNQNNKINITCNAEFSCTYTSIHAYNANEININCIGFTSCINYFTVNGTDANMINIYDESNGIPTGMTSWAPGYLYFENVKLFNLSCIGGDACGFNLDVNNADDVNIYAADYGMDHVFIKAGNSTNFTLTCVTSNRSVKDACYRAKLLLNPEADQINIHCIGRGCYNLQLFFKNKMRSLEHVNISILNDGQCLSTQTCLGDWYLNCDYSSTQDVFPLYGGYVCYDDRCDCNYWTRKIQQSWNQSLLMNPTKNVSYRVCEKNQHCKIVCSGGCSNVIIDSKMALSLSLSCNTVSSCMYSEVHCPTIINSVCNVHCNAWKACYKIIIVGYPQTQLLIQSTMREALASGLIYGSDSNHIILKCSDSLYSCYSVGLRAFHAKSVHVLCTGYSLSSDHHDASCTSLQIMSSMAQQVMLECTGTYSCHGTFLDANNAHNVTIFANGKYAMESSLIRVQNASYFSLICAGHSVTYGCYDSRVYLGHISNNNNNNDTRNNVSLMCYGYGCYEFTLYVDNGMDALSSLTDIVLNACGVASTFHNIFQEWIIYCSNSTQYDTNIWYYGQSCSSRACDCHQHERLLIDLFINNPNDSQCAFMYTLSPTNNPTVEPTTNPTIEPTAKPTSEPTNNSTLFPSIHPTIIPTTNSSTTTETIANSTIKNSIVASNCETNGRKMTFDIIVTVALVVALSIIALVVAYYCRKRNKKSNNNHVEMGNLLGSTTLKEGETVS